MPPDWPPDWPSPDWPPDWPPPADALEPDAPPLDPVKMLSFSDGLPDAEGNPSA
jgi:hypothetical protein